MVNATLRPLYPLERVPVPIVEEAGWATGPVWKGAENLAPTEVRTPDHPARSESLYRLSYSGRTWLCPCKISAGASRSEVRGTGTSSEGISLDHNFSFCKSSVNVLTSTPFTGISAHNNPPLVPYPQPNESSSCHPIQFMIHFHIILSPTPRSSRWPLYLRLPHQNPTYNSSPPIRTTFFLT